MNKIIMITGSFPPDKCGVGDYTKLLCDNLSLRNYDIHIISSYKIDSVKYDIHSDIKDWSIKNIFKIMKLISDINPDIIHIQYPTKAYGKKLLINFLPFLLRLKKYFVVTTIHEYSTNTLLGKIRTYFNALAANKVIVVDPIYLEDLKRHGLNEKRINYINIASNIPKCTLTINEKENFKQSLNLKNNLIGYFGFINKSKGLESLLESMYILKKECKLSSSLVIIAELSLDDKYQRSILDLINKYELNNDILITGYLEENMVAKYISICDFFVFPFVDGYSPKNGSCLAALQEGKQIITTASKTKIDNLDNIIFIDRYDNIRMLVEQINILQKIDDRSNIYDNSIFTWDYVVKRHDDIYISILNK